MLHYSYNDRKYPVVGTGETAKRNALIETFYRIYDMDNMIHPMRNYAEDNKYHLLLSRLMNIIRDPPTTDIKEQKIIKTLTRVYQNTGNFRVRRVVTGSDIDGKSIIKMDSQIDAIQGREGFEYVPVWATENPVIRSDGSIDDPSTWTFGNNSLDNGTVFRIARYEPGVAGRWHQTNSLDYGIVLSGEMWLQTEKEEVHLRTGDTIIQRATSHNWVNRGSEPCVMAFVLVGNK